jgi:hypothetical protein
MNLPSLLRAPVPKSVPPRPAGDPVPPSKSETDVNCPRCYTKLTDPSGLGLCEHCGYCRSLELGGVAVLAGARSGPWQTLLRGLKQALIVAPPATFALCVAFVAVVPTALIADQRFAPGSRARALWSTGSLLCGIVLLLTGQAWAVAVLKRMRERVTWDDMASPLQVWSMALRRIPDTAWPVGLAGSGMLAILAAVVWVGGLSYWLRTNPPPDDNGVASAPAAAAPRRRDTREEQDMARVSRILGSRLSDQTAGPVESPVSSGAPGPSVGHFESRLSAPPPTVPTDDARPTERCVVVGIVPASGEQSAGLVLARLRDGQLTFAGVVRNGLNKMPDVLDRLSKLGRARPVVDGLTLDAVWVRPEVFCEVHQSGEDEKGELVDPALKGLIED